MLHENIDIFNGCQYCHMCKKFEADLISGILIKVWPSHQYETWQCRNIFVPFRFLFLSFDEFRALKAYFCMIVWR